MNSLFRRTAATLAPRTAATLAPRTAATLGRRSAATLGAALIILGATSAGAGEAPASPITTTLSHGDASVEVSTVALGLDVERASSGAILAVRWDKPRFSAECEALNDALSLVPPFEGDVDVDDTTVEAVYPVAGQAIDCGALAIALERRLAAAGPWAVEVPVAVREPHVSVTAIDALAADVRTMLEAPLTLDVTFRGEPVGSVTLSPDEVRAALRITVVGDPPRLEGRLDPAALSEDLDPVIAALGEPAQDAKLVVDAHDRVRVVAGRPGVRLDAARLFGAAQEAAKKADKKAAVAADKGEPQVTTKKAEALQIKGLVASFTTKHPTHQPRVTNIHRSAALLDGAIVEEGERFSLNRQIGKRTARRGFVLAPSIGEGEMVETIGGGVSQLATTLYNAVFDGGYAVVSRKPHTFYFTRYPLGVEATLSWPRPDFVFRNDSRSGVLIRASFTDDSVTVKLYGDNESRKVKRFASKTFAPTDPRTDYEPDETLPIDKLKVKDAGTQGFSVTAGRDIVFANGTKKYEERKVIYHGKPRIVAAHPCAIPKGEKGRRKKGCPKPDEGLTAEQPRDLKGAKGGKDDAGKAAVAATMPVGKGADKAPDKVADKAPEKGPKKAPAKAADKATGKASDKADGGTDKKKKKVKVAGGT